MSSCPLFISMLVKFNIHKDLDIPGEMEEAVEFNFYVNLWSLCFEEAELDNRLQFIKYRRFGSEYTPGRCQQHQIFGMEVFIYQFSFSRRWGRGERANLLNGNSL